MLDFLKMRNSLVRDAHKKRRTHEGVRYFFFPHSTVCIVFVSKSRNRAMLPVYVRWCQCGRERGRYKCKHKKLTKMTLINIIARTETTFMLPLFHCPFSWWSHFLSLSDTHTHRADTLGLSQLIKSQ